MKIIGIEMFPVSMSFRRRIKTAFRGVERDEGVSEDNVIIRIYTARVFIPGLFFIQERI